MLEIWYCENCKNRICEWGGIAFSLFTCICEDYLENNPIEISTSVHDYNHGCLEIIRFLELKGYVVTTESGMNLIQVKPCGLEIIDDLCLICLEHKD